jgi:S-adenosylmethionine:tRNA-ribosyltransferase-isomerase (queuine synthetase)
MRVDEFDFDLPPERDRAAGRRSRVTPHGCCCSTADGHARPAGSATCRHCCGRGDLLVFNDTRVIPGPARTARAAPRRSDAMLHKRGRGRGAGAPSPAMPSG